MKKSQIYIVLAGLLLTLLSWQIPSAKEESEGWTVLFDGTDLSQWETIEGGEWSIEGDVLIGKNGRNWSTDPEKTGSYLRTKKMYDDFILELDYAINARGNSGVMFRSGPEKNPTFTGYEWQITDCYGKELGSKSMGLYDTAPPTENRAKPTGEWNHVVIKAQGAEITVEWNGKVILNYTGNRRTEGYIGLQNHDDHSVVKFRNVRIKEL